MTVIDELFGKSKAIIAMAHFPAMPGQPLYDARLGVRGMRDAVARDVEILAASEVDAVMFCNDGDRPYRTRAGPEVTAVMASVIANTGCARRRLPTCSRSPMRASWARRSSATATRGTRSRARASSALSARRLPAGCGSPHAMGDKSVDQEEVQECAG